MAIWADQYQIKDVAQMQYNQDSLDKLRQWTQGTSTPHLIIQGPPGSGKHTMALLYLMEKWGDRVWNQRLTTKTFKINSKDHVVMMIRSPIHFTFNLSRHDTHDRLILTQYINELIQFGDPELPHRTIIMQDADQLTIEAQEAMRRVLEKYVRTARFIYLCNNEHRLIPPLRSRCQMVRIAGPSLTQLDQVLLRISQDQGFRLSAANSRALGCLSHRNTKMAINLLQLNVLRGCDLSTDSAHPDLVQSDQVGFFIEEHLIKIMRGRNLVADVSTCRSLMYGLLVNCVEHRQIIVRCMDQYIERVLSFCSNTNSQPRPVGRRKAGQPRKFPLDPLDYIEPVVEAAQKYEHLVHTASQPVYCLEAFLLVVLQQLKRMTFDGGFNPYSMLGSG